MTRSERRQREAARERLAECRRELREALAEPVPDPASVLELSAEERLLQERLAGFRFRSSSAAGVELRT
jgi:hypothetical protein